MIQQLESDGSNRANVLNARYATIHLDSTAVSVTLRLTERRFVFP